MKYYKRQTPRMRNSKRHSIDKTKCVNTKKNNSISILHYYEKKTYSRKFLALFLTGTLLAGVGCKDYDDDIDKLNDRPRRVDHW